MSTAPEKVTTQRGTSLQLRARLGRGGQGAVYATDFDRYVVKRLDAGGPASRARLTRRVARVRRLALEDLHVARPLELLEAPDTGYVMELMADMQPLERLMVPAPGASLAEWFVATGGWRRRLRLLAHAGEALAALHARGLVYADPSPANVFVSVDPQASEAWLIDCDNLHHPGWEDAPAVHTPPWGAPELVEGRADTSSASDAHAFATMVWAALTFTHPLLGDLVQDGSPSLEARALAGELPWVGDTSDPRNHTTRGFPPTLVLSPKLRRLSAAAFGPGLSDRLARPSVAAWVEALHSAADFCVACPRCRSTYSAAHPQCPWCEEEPRPSLVLVEAGSWVPTEQRARLLCGADGQPLDDAPKPHELHWLGPTRFSAVVSAAEDAGLWLTGRHRAGVAGASSRLPLLRLRWHRHGVELEPAPDADVYVLDPAEDRPKPLDRRARVLSWQHRVLLGSPERPCRVLRFSPSGGGR